MYQLLYKIILPNYFSCIVIDPVKVEIVSRHSVILYRKLGVPFTKVIVFS